MFDKLAKGALAATLGFAMLAAPAVAAPFVPVKPAASAPEASPVIDVRDHHRRDHRRGFYSDRRGGWYNGHRGYRHHRPGYRHYNGYWFPPAAFALGVIIGQGANRVEPGVRPGYTSPAHVNWCSNRYRSYRVYDNSWQPNYGPRRECRSPYF